MQNFFESDEEEKEMSKVEEIISQEWVHLSTEDIGSHINKLVEDFDDYVQVDGKTEQWRVKHDFYHNNFMDHHSRLGLAQVGKQQESLFFGNNYFKTFAKHIKNNATSLQVNFDVRAKSADTVSMHEVMLGKNILEHYTKTKSMKRYIDRAFEHCLVFDAGYLLMEWDVNKGDMVPDELTQTVIFSGDLSFKNPVASNVIFDPLKAYWEDHQWFIIRDSVPRTDLLHMFKDREDLIELINGANSKSDELMFDVMQSTSYPLKDLNDDVVVLKLFYDRTISVPDGRYVLALADGTVLYDSPVGLPYKRIPLMRIVADEYIGNTFGDSPLNYIVAHQEALNHIESTIMTNQAALGSNFIAYKEGTDFNAASLGQGTTGISYKDIPPSVLKLNAISNDVFSYRSAIIDSMQNHTGITDASMGKTKSGDAGSLAALMVSQTQQFNSPIQANYAKFCAEAGTMVIDILKDNASMEREVQISSGKNTSRSVFTGNDIQGIDKVYVDMGNPMTNSPAGALLAAESLLKMGLIDALQYFEVLQKGTLDAGTKGVQMEIDCINGENETLLTGVEIQPHPRDNDELHLKYHRQMVMKSEFRPAKNDKDLTILENMEHHMQLHEQAIARKQQMQIPQPQQSEPMEEVGNIQQNPQRSVPAPAQPLM